MIKKIKGKDQILCHTKLLKNNHNPEITKAFVNNEWFAVHCTLKHIHFFISSNFFVTGRV